VTFGLHSAVILSSADIVIQTLLLTPAVVYSWLCDQNDISVGVDCCSNQSVGVAATQIFY